MTGYEPHFNGPAYEPGRDFARLTSQLDRVRELMLDGEWRTVAEVATQTRDPEPSVSAQLRHLRKQRFGSYVVERRLRRSPGLWEFRVCKPEAEE